MASANHCAWFRPLRGGFGGIWGGGAWGVEWPAVDAARDAAGPLLTILCSPTSFVHGNGVLPPPLVAAALRSLARPPSRSPSPSHSPSRTAVAGFPLYYQKHRPPLPPGHCCHCCHHLLLHHLLLPPLHHLYPPILRFPSPIVSATAPSGSQVPNSPLLDIATIRFATSVACTIPTVTPSPDPPILKRCECAPLLSYRNHHRRRRPYTAA